jgi:membrane protease YdiL (CAAX protease family)
VEPPALAGAVRPRPIDRATALVEVAICSGFPTQMALGATLAVLGFAAGRPDSLDAGFVVALALGDSVLLIGLIFVFLGAHRESPQQVFLGQRPPRGELVAAIPLTFVALALAVGVLAGIQLFAPWLHTVDRNPLQELIETPGQAALFALVVVVAGGVREELQRAFLLRRFERSLGGGTTGVLVTSAAFGIGHYVQGADAMIATALLGGLWAVTYLRRGSVVAPLVSHAGFNLLQLAQFLVLRG